jgi:hypothetical protein
VRQKRPAAQSAQRRSRFLLVLTFDRQSCLLSW